MRCAEVDITYGPYPKIILLLLLGGALEATGVLLGGADEGGVLEAMGVLLGGADEGGVLEATGVLLGGALEAATLLDATLDTTAALEAADDTAVEGSTHTSIFIASTCSLLPASIYTENPV